MTDMDIIETSIEVSIESFLDRTLFCFLATIDEEVSRVSPLWFLWEDESIWIIANRQKTYPCRVEQNQRTALAIVDFDQETGSVEHVGMRGQASLQEHDPARVERLLSKYLAPHPNEWDRPFFGDPYEWGDEMIMIRFDPETIVARDQSYAPASSIEQG